MPLSPDLSGRGGSLVHRTRYAAPPDYGGPMEQTVSLYPLAYPCRWPPPKGTEVERRSRLRLCFCGPCSVIRPSQTRRQAEHASATLAGIPLLALADRCCLLSAHVSTHKNTATVGIEHASFTFSGHPVPTPWRSRRYGLVLNFGWPKINRQPTQVRYCAARNVNRFVGGPRAQRHRPTAHVTRRRFGLPALRVSPNSDVLLNQK